MTGSEQTRTDPGKPGSAAGTSPAPGGASAREATAGGGTRTSGRPGRSAGGGIPHADELLDELMPEEVDWEHLVRTYPWPALAIATAAGFYLGVSRGPLLLGAVAGWASGEVSRRVDDLFGEVLS